MVLDNVYYVPKLWYNLFSILEALRRGWSIGNKGMHISISKGRSTIEFDRLFKCPTGHLIGVIIKSTDEFGAVADSKMMGRISHEKGHSLLMHANADVTCRTLQKLGWKLEGPVNRLSCMSCAIEKSKQKKVAKWTQTKASKPGERLFIDISSMKERSLGGSKFWALIVDDYSDYMWGRFFNKKSDLSENVMPILKKLFM